MECIKTKSRNSLVGTRKGCQDDRWCFAYQESGIHGYRCDGETKQATNKDQTKNLKTGAKVVWIKGIYFKDTNKLFLLILKHLKMFESNYIWFQDHLNRF